MEVRTRGWLNLSFLVTICAFIVIFCYTQISVEEGKFEKLIVGLIVILSLVVVRAIAFLINLEVDTLNKENLALEKIVEELDRQNTELRSNEEESKEESAAAEA